MCQAGAGPNWNFNHVVLTPSYHQSSCASTFNTTHLLLHPDPSLTVFLQPDQRARLPAGDDDHLDQPLKQNDIDPALCVRPTCPRGRERRRRHLRWRGLQQAFVCQHRQDDVTALASVVTFAGAAMPREQQLDGVGTLLLESLPFAVAIASAKIPSGEDMGYCGTSGTGFIAGDSETR